MEGGALGVDIVLVDLVGKDEELLLGGKTDDALHVVPGQHLECTIIFPHTGKYGEGGLGGCTSSFYYKYLSKIAIFIAYFHSCFFFLA